MSRVLGALKRMPHMYRRLRQARLAVGELLPPRKVDGIAGRVHWNDLMFAGDTPENYRRIGREAFGWIEEALDRVGRRPSEIDRILDFGCGYGRVARVLRQKFEPARICAFDVDWRGPAFCSRELGVDALFVNDSWNSVPFSRYDLIWVGSVLTHLSQAYVDQTLTLLSSLLRPQGLLLFTTQGDEGLRRLQQGAYGDDYRAGCEALVRDYHQRGFAFAAYPYCDDPQIGMAWGTVDYFQRRVAATSERPLAPVFCRPQGWDNHQDVFAYQAPEEF